MSEYKVVFHIDEINKLRLLLNNVGNLLNVADNKFCIEVVANSEAVKCYTKNQDADVDINIMDSLNQKGVKFVACNNALMGYDIKKDALPDFVDIVPAGVMELVKKQSEGYFYIKP